MSSTAQIEANRQNAQKSTGPVTPEGKAASSNNNYRHGFRGLFRVLPGEPKEVFDALLAGLRHEHQPETTTDEILIQRMAQHHWLSERARSTIQLAIQTSDIPFDEMMPEVQLWMRYQTSNERAFHKCLNDLLKLKAERRKTHSPEDARPQAVQHSSWDEAVHSQPAKESSANAAAGTNGFERQKPAQANAALQQQVPPTYETIQRTIACTPESSRPATAVAPARAKDQRFQSSLIK